MNKRALISKYVIITGLLLIFSAIVFLIIVFASDPNILFEDGDVNENIQIEINANSKYLSLFLCKNENLGPRISYVLYDGDKQSIIANGTHQIVHMETKVRYYPDVLIELPDTGIYILELNSSSEIKMNSYSIKIQEFTLPPYIMDYYILIIAFGTLFLLGCLGILWIISSDSQGKINDTDILLKELGIITLISFSLSIFSIMIIY